MKQKILLKRNVSNCIIALKIPKKVFKIKKLVCFFSVVQRRLFTFSEKVRMKVEGGSIYNKKKKKEKGFKRIIENRR